MDREIERTMELFERICSIPRCSKKEERIAGWISDWAEERGFSWERDEAGNLLVRIPASEGCGKAPTVVLQGHMDMVCEKLPGADHDFSEDPVKPVYEGDWVRAEGTTLGADNGIGLALTMDLASDPDVVRPALELLFTADEETGLNGAGRLRENWLSGRTYINIDSEDDRTFTIGCAGGLDTVISLPAKTGALEGPFEIRRLSVSGLRGGHSGIDIHRRRGNAIKLLARVLRELLESGDARLISIEGGSARNAIPRDAGADLAFPPDRVEYAEAVAKGFRKTAANELGDAEPGLKIALEKGARERGADPETIVPEDALRTVRLLLALPHGVYQMSGDMPDLVETSGNLATVKTGDGSVRIATSQRSSVESRLEEIAETVKAAAGLAGATCEHENRYPAWPPDMDSPLLSLCEEVYERMFGEKPEVKAIHAGLECGVAGSKYPDMDMISVGPDIEGAHSPGERLRLGSVAKIRAFLAETLKALSSLQK